MPAGLSPLRGFLAIGSLLICGDTRNFWPSTRKFVGGGAVLLSHGTAARLKARCTHLLSIQANTLLIPAPLAGVLPTCRMASLLRMVALDPCQ
jgi:hypothetical protein